MKRRIWYVCCANIILIVLATVLILAQQARISSSSSKIAVTSRRQIILGTQVLETLSDIDRRARAGGDVSWEVARFRKMTSDLSSELRSDEDSKTLDHLQFKFNNYVDSLPTLSSKATTDAQLKVIQSYYQDVTSDIASLMESSGNSTLKTLQDLSHWQAQASEIALYCMVAFIVLTMVACYFAIAAITRPLSTLASFLDRVDVEDDLPSSVPQLESTVSEISTVAHSFEHVLQRLRGYRALNVRRLLIEKRRADIIAASISDGVFLLRGDEILYANPIAERILGIREEGVNPVGWNLKALSAVPVEATPDTQRRRAALAILTAVSRTLPVELTVETPDRRSFYLIQSYPLSCDLIEQVEHAVSGSVASGLRPDTRYIEKVLDRFQANILVVAQDVTLVRESQEARGHFLATLSHEIKTPVTSLTMATRLLAKMIHEIPNPTQRGLISTCVEDVDRLRRLLEDLLTISRFDTLAQRLELQTIDLIKLVKNSVQSFQAEARERGVLLNYSAQASTPDEPQPRSMLVSMDATKVAWALSNLLTNALRHTPRNGFVTAQVVCTGEDWVEVRVKDTGPGIDRKRQSRIFDKFSPFYDIRVARSGSTGAGLSIAREIITAHGGRIWVSSEPGQGAEFCFTLPLNRSHMDALIANTPNLTGNVGNTAIRQYNERSL